MKRSSDLNVDQWSDSLAGIDLDLVVSGSIGAIESPRLIRAIRRLGGIVKPWLTRGGSSFVTPLVLEWASSQDCITEFSGKSPHIATGAACVVAPASANFIYKIAHGITDTPASALVASYAGQGLPILLVPNMHESMANAPAVAENLMKIKSWIRVLEPRVEEGKWKFPDPAVLADEISHAIAVVKRTSDTPATPKKVAVVFGGTKARLDAVRHLGNYSSGAFGSECVQSFYRRGYETQAYAVGTPGTLPHVYSKLTQLESNDELERAILTFSQKYPEATIVFLPAVLDFVPVNPPSEVKLSSSQDLPPIALKRSPKILGKLSNHIGPIIAAKLETTIENDSIEKARSYLEHYNLKGIVVNSMDKIREAQYAAVFLSSRSAGDLSHPFFDSRRSLAEYLARSV